MKSKAASQASYCGCLWHQRHFHFGYAMSHLFGCCNSHFNPSSHSTSSPSSVPFCQRREQFKLHQFHRHHPHHHPHHQHQHQQQQQQQHQHEQHQRQHLRRRQQQPLQLQQQQKQHEQRLQVKSHHLLNAQYLLLLLLCVLLVHPIYGWQENIPPKVRIASLNHADVQRFSSGNNSLKLLEQDGDSILIGGRNVMYNISLSTLTENKRLEWYSGEDVVSRCRLKGKSEEDCQNYIRVLARKSPDLLFVCGTNAFKPACRNYSTTSGPGSWYEWKGKEDTGEGLCPYGPKYNLITTFAGSLEERTEDNLYVATVAHFSGTDPIIYRKPLRTHQYNPKHLNAPNFVNSFYHEGQVYFFFRETAVEYINCGKRIYSRVARVCTKDKGGSYKYGDHWTTFVKARLNCSIPGEFPFYFDEVQSTTNLVKGIYNGRPEQIIYGVFTTPVNSLGSSAICAFRMDDIMNIFETGQFKGQENSNSNWLPIPPSRVPEPRPGGCVNDSKSQSDQTLNFVRDHPLMDSTVPSFFGRPILIQSSFKFRLTQIAVDPQIQTLSGTFYDVIFVGTDDGRVMKVINVGQSPNSAGGSSSPGSSSSSSTNNNNNSNKVSPVIIEDITVFQNRVPITNLLVYHTYYEAKLVVMSNSEIQAIPLHKCQSRANSCSTCIALQDPYCAWDTSRGVCTSSRSRFHNPDNFIQNIEEGWDGRCDSGSLSKNPTNLLNRPPLPDVLPDGENEISSQANRAANSFNSPNNPYSTSAKSGIVVGSPNSSTICTAETMAFAVVTSIVASFVVGFILGHIISRRCKKDHNFDHTGLGFHPYSDPTGYTDYQITGALGAQDAFPPSSTYGMIGLNGGNGSESTSHRPTLITGTNASLHNGGHLPGHLVNNQPGKPINLVLNVPPNTKGGKNANSSADNKPLALKVKKIYL